VAVTVADIETVRKAVSGVGAGASIGAEVADHTSVALGELGKMDERLKPEVAAPRIDLNRKRVALNDENECAKSEVAAP
jgi:hypothetical protein